MEHLREKNVVKDENRATTNPPFTDLHQAGLKKLTTTTWLQDLLTKGIGEGDEDEPTAPFMEDNEEIFELF